MRIASSLFLAVSFALFGTAALAGQHTVTPVTVLSSFAVVYANGGASDAYNSADTQQYIGCSVGATASGSPSIDCEAMTSGGIQARCVSSDPALVQVATAISGESIISFRYSTAAPAPAPCTDLKVSNFSYTGPKL